MNQFLYSKDGKVTFFLTESKGQKFKGVAKSSNTDEYKKEIENTLCSIGYQYSVINEDPRFNDCLFYPDK